MHTSLSMPLFFCFALFSEILIHLRKVNSPTGHCHNYCMLVLYLKSDCLISSTCFFSLEFCFILDWEAKPPRLWKCSVFFGFYTQESMSFVICFSWTSYCQILLGNQGPLVMNNPLHVFLILFYSRLVQVILWMIIFFKFSYFCLHVGSRQISAFYVYLFCPNLSRASFAIIKV